MSSKVATFSVSCSPELLQRIDQAAARTSQSRSAYVISWLPEARQTGDIRSETPPREDRETARA